MLRKLSLLLLVMLLLLAAPLLFGATCQVEMTVSCVAGANNAPSQCTATTTNIGGGTCAGLFYAGWFAGDEDKNVKFTGSETSLQLDDCLDSDDFPENPQAFSFCFGDAALASGASFTSTIHVTGAKSRFPMVAVTWIGNDNYDELSSAYAFVNLEQLSCKPAIAVPPIAQTGTFYNVAWSGVSDPTAKFIVEESTLPDFTANFVTQTVTGLQQTFRHEVNTATTYYYRVKPNSCQGGTPAYSNIAQITVQPRPNTTVKNAEIAVPLGSAGAVQLNVFVPGIGVPASFQASIDKPYLDVTPKTGTMPAEGQTFTITASPGTLPAGANTGTLRVIATSLLAAGGGATTTALNIPVSISLVTPVTPGAKTTPPANAMIIPVVTHVNGAAGPFLSDVRLTNGSGAAVNYQITMTPTQTDGTVSSKVTEISVDPEQTVALNDIVKNFFGYGATDNPNDFGFGALEIRPVNSSTTLTYASSRTYASTVFGTFGQFIAAVPFSLFATQRTSGIPIPGGPPPGITPILSLQQIAQSAKFRTNLGLVEGAGEPAQGRIRVFNNLGTLLKEVPYSLRAGEHVQWNRFLEFNAGIPQLEDGRIEVTVDSPTGAVSAYASVLDNVTTDPLAVMPVDVSKIVNNRYVIPGMAELPNGTNNFHSDLRVFNGGPGEINTTLTYYPQGNGAPLTAIRPIASGAILSIDNVLPALFNATNTGGSIVITTGAPSALVVTGRTYTNVDGGGTYGQFIPGVMPEEGVGRNDPALQVLQLEQSDRFRSNLGLAELTGNAATVRVSLTLPDSKVTPSVNVDLAPNEFRQLGRVIESLLGGGTQTYNSRITVEVLAGNGRVTAYGSVIDNESKDPTYVPAQ
ncbi:MAG TPA: hypothetical protein VHW00_05050 [Thermoanaerobaculia bacterium]|nr:hypothetical protein [Thermoanaerobaculia bacterium]